MRALLSNKSDWGWIGGRERKDEMDFKCLNHKCTNGDRASKTSQTGEDHKDKNFRSIFGSLLQERPISPPRFSRFNKRSIVLVDFPQNTIDHILTKILITFAQSVLVPWQNYHMWMCNLTLSVMLLFILSIFLHHIQGVPPELRLLSRPTTTKPYIRA